MRVSAADFSYKTQKDKPQSSGKEKKKIMKKTQKLNKYGVSLLALDLGRRRVTDVWKASSRTGTTTTRKPYRIRALGGTKWSF